MWPEKTKAWASMADDPLKRASSANPSSLLHRYSPATMAGGGLLVVGALGYLMFKGKQGRLDDHPAPRP